LKELEVMMRNYLQRPIALLASLLIFTALGAHAQSGSTRPRRVSRQTARTEKTPATTDKPSDSLLDVEPANSTGRPRNTGASAPASNPDVPLLNTTASTPVGAPVSAPTSGASDTSHAFTLLQGKQYEAALKEARQVADNNPNDSEAW
jgi:hypothetical protein